MSGAPLVPCDVGVVVVGAAVVAVAAAEAALTLAPIPALWDDDRDPLISNPAPIPIARVAASANRLHARHPNASRRVSADFCREGGEPVIGTTAVAVGALTEGGAGAGDCPIAGAGPTPSSCPHKPQKRSPSSRAWPQYGQNRSPTAGTVTPDVREQANPTRAQMRGQPAATVRGGSLRARENTVCRGGNAGIRPGRHWQLLAGWLRQ